jgi:tetratricopeptide (TPR) repeat protein
MTRRRARRLVARAGTRAHAEAARDVRLAAASPTRWGGARRLAAFIALAAAVTYLNSLSNPLIMDDRIAIAENPQIRSLSPSVALFPPDESAVARRPLVNLSLALNYAIGGLDVRGYHAVNLAIHVLAALGLFGVVRRTLARDSFLSGMASHATALATASTFLWLLHPLHTEVVNYVSQRTSAMMGLAYLLTLYCSIRALEDPSRRWTAAAVLACAAGMACKETMVTAPVMVVLFDRVFVYSRLRDAWTARRGLYLGLASTWLVLAALMLSGGRSTVGFATGVSPWTYLLNQCAILVDYLRLAFWPDALVVDYGLPRPLALGQVAVQAAFLTLLALSTLAALRVAPRVGFLGIAFFVLLAPTSSVVPIATEVGAERRMYLPLAALVVLLVCAGYRLGAACGEWARRRWQSLRSLDGRVGRLVAVTLVVVLCAALGVRAAARNHEYRSKVDLWNVTVERRPHGRAFMLLGSALLDAGRRPEAIESFRRSTADYAPGHFALGTELLVSGQVNRGIAQLREFMRLMPNDPAVVGARLMIGTAFLDLQRYLDAANEFRFVVSRQPRNALARLSLGEALVNAGRSRDALPHLQEAVRVRPGDPRAHNVLGAALADSGRLDEAIRRFEAALAIDPRHGGARANLTHARRLRAAASARGIPSP